MNTTLTQSETIRRKTHRLSTRITETILHALHEKGIKNYNSYLADKLNTSRPNITRLLNGDGNFTMKSLLNLVDAAGFEIEIKFFHQHNLKPFEYIQVSSVNLPVDSDKLVNNQYFQQHPTQKVASPIYLVDNNQIMVPDENLLSNFISVIRENQNAYHS